MLRKVGLVSSRVATIALSGPSPSLANSTSHHALRMRRMMQIPTSRSMSSESSAPPPSSGGSTFFQRLSSFLAGIGATAPVGYYFIYQDVKRSTELAEASLNDIISRIEALEKR